MRRYAIVVEDAGANLAAYVPDLPGCVVTGESEEEVGYVQRFGVGIALARKELEERQPRSAIRCPGQFCLVA
jgi:hypothetical protein